MRKQPAANAERLIELACQIQQIPAPTFHEGKRADFMLEHFQAIGYADAFVDEAGNVLARAAGGTRRSLVISAHLDSVHPLDADLSLRYETDRISGAGIADNALGLATLLWLGEQLKTGGLRLPGTVWLAANVAEEGLGNLKGMHALADRFQNQPLGYLVLEGIGLGNVYHAGLGVNRYEIRVTGSGGHSWADYGRTSAIHELARFITRVAGLRLPEMPRSSLNFGMISGGTSVNTIAAHAQTLLDLRSEDGQTLARLSEQISDIANACSHAGARFEVEQVGLRPPGRIDPQHPLVQLAVESLAAQGLKANLSIASTDANVPLSRGYPAVCMGITHGGNAHTAAEYFQTAPVAQGLAVLLQFLEGCWKLQ